MTRPRIVCLCGSTRFKDAFDEANYQETMAGRIVLSVGFFMHATGNRHGGRIGATPEQKLALDELHKRKIDLADEVLVLNVDGYIGDSTRSEIAYALQHEKPVRYLESPENRGCYMSWKSIDTAPRDGRWVLLRGESGYASRPYRVHVGRWDAGYRPRSPWQTSEGRSFTDDGGEPTHWMELPE